MPPEDAAPQDGRITVCVDSDSLLDEDFIRRLCANIVLSRRNTLDPAQVRLEVIKSLLVGGVIRPVDCPQVAEPLVDWILADPQPPAEAEPEADQTNFPSA